MFAHAFYTRRIIIPFRLAKALPRRDLLFLLIGDQWFDARGSTFGSGSGGSSSTH